MTDLITKLESKVIKFPYPTVFDTDEYVKLNDVKKLLEAITVTPCCTELCDKENQAYDKGWEDGAKVGADDVSSRM